ncbi:unnamed protein product [Orchesella dallaii]|uniref:Death domain-containing protein n=1 Tax=Orchesella dallaii TaxID=48710 RepID=A0ABP1R5W3_9HEXA
MANSRWGDYSDILVVGDEPCTFLNIRTILTNSTGSAKLWSELMDLATTLKIRDDIIQTLRTGIIAGLVTRTSALVEILQTWRAQFSSNAKLSTLILALEERGLKDCADSLRNQC